jgi:site-specific recombinase XerD
LLADIGLYLTYLSSKRNGHERTYSKTLPELEEMRKKIKRNCYAGIATKKLQKYLKERDRTNNSMVAFAKSFRRS